jgi:tetratricopeptide (TPR) repeat protein
MRRIGMLGLLVATGCSSLQGPPVTSYLPFNQVALEEHSLWTEQLPGYLGAHASRQPASQARLGLLGKWVGFGLGLVAGSFTYVQVHQLALDQGPDGSLAGYEATAAGALVFSLLYGLGKKFSNHHINQALDGYLRPHGGAVPLSVDELMRRGDFAEAARRLSDEIGASPSAEAYRELGDCRLNLKQPDKALEAYEAALAMDPEDEKLKKMVQGLKLELRR